MDYIKVNNLHKYQHYSDRNMIWFKWHIDCLYDYKFSKLTNSAKWVFIGLICLACKSQNRIPNDYAWIAKQISTYGEPIDDEMCLLLASKMLATCYQNARLDKIREDKIRIDKNILLADTPILTVVNHYKVKTGYKKEDKAWDKAHFPRCSKSAKTLIDFCGSPTLAIACIDSVVSDMDKKKLTWTLETIVKHSADWKRDYQKNNETELKRQIDLKKAEEFAREMA